MTWQWTIRMNSIDTAHAPYLVLLDMDSTFIKNEVIDLLAIKAGVWEEVSKITESAMRGELDFKESLSARTSLLQGLNEKIIDEVRNEIELSLGALELIQGVHDKSSVIGIVSGGFDNVIAPLLTKLKIDFFKANELGIIDGVLTGKTIGSVIDKFAKMEYLKEQALRYKIPLSRCIAVGDGANDIEMMKVAGLSIAFNAKPKVRDSADICIDDGDLRHILEFLV